MEEEIPTGLRMDTTPPPPPVKTGPPKRGPRPTKPEFPDATPENCVRWSIDAKHRTLPGLTQNDETIICPPSEAAAIAVFNWRNPWYVVTSIKRAAVDYVDLRRQFLAANPL